MSLYAGLWLAVSAVAGARDPCGQAPAMAAKWACIEVLAEGYRLAGQRYDSAAGLLASIREASELKFVLAGHCGSSAQFDRLLALLNEDPRVRDYVFWPNRASLRECTPEGGIDVVDPKFQGFGVRAPDHSSVEKS
ncbi:MAG: hypothetical protein AAGI15_01920 [Pseudomonadota bacterium]